MAQDTAAILQRVIQATNAAGHPLTAAQIEQWRTFLNAIMSARDTAVAQRESIRAEKDARNAARIKELEERLMQERAERRGTSPIKTSSEPAAAAPPSVVK